MFGRKTNNARIQVLVFLFMIPCPFASINGNRNLVGNVRQYHDIFSL